MDKSITSKRQPRCQNQNIRNFGPMTKSLMLLQDADFDSYWLDESRNKNRNRIRVGRQYQATVPPLLKPGETDGRRCEDLETLKWKPDYEISEEQLDHYLSVAKAVSLFAKAINVCQKAETPKCLQSALRGLSEFVTSHHPCHHDDGCKVPNESTSSISASSAASFQSVVSTKPHLSTGTWPIDEKGEGASSSSNALGSLGRCEWTPQEADLFAKALEVCGKNFGAIKKEFLPWKPVKSIIEFYYCGKGDIKSTGDSNSPTTLQLTNFCNEHHDEPSASTKCECNTKLENISPTPPCGGSGSSSRGSPSTSRSTPGDTVPPVGITAIDANNPTTSSASDNGGKKEQDEKPFKEEKCNSVQGKLCTKHFIIDHQKYISDIMVPPPSVYQSRLTSPPPSQTGETPVKNKDNASSINIDEQAAGSTVGSLKFYLGGQLVLKLNAKQEASSARPEGSKCQWVQSKDTPKLLSSHTRKLQKHRKKAKEHSLIKKELSDGAAVTSCEGPREGSSSPSDRDGTDSERSRTPDCFQAKKARVKCYPTSSSASSIASCCSNNRLSPKPPWTPPVEILKWDKSPTNSHSDEGGHQGDVNQIGSGVKVKQENSQLRSKTDLLNASGHRISPTGGVGGGAILGDPNFCYILPKPKQLSSASVAYGKTMEIASIMSGGHSPGGIIGSSITSGNTATVGDVGLDDIRNYRGIKPHSIHTTVRDHTRELLVKSPWSNAAASCSSPMMTQKHIFPVVCSPVSFTKPSEDCPLDLSKKSVQSHESPGKSASSLCSESRARLSPIAQQLRIAGSSRSSQHLAPFFATSVNHYKSPSLQGATDNKSKTNNLKQHTSSGSKESGLKNGKE